MTAIDELRDLLELVRERLESANLAKAEADALIEAWGEMLDELGVVVANMEAEK
jgi:hypothetical protein